MGEEGSDRRAVPLSQVEKKKKSRKKIHRQGKGVHPPIGGGENYLPKGKKEKKN